jgi:DNA-binding transcriptional MerR regulator
VQEPDELIPIGELARRASVPVKTLRFYSDTGVVPPARRTAAGYRLYGERERVRLETVKTLRGLGFGLDEISAALEQRRDLRDAIKLQLHAVEGRIHQLQRIAVVLRAGLERTDEPTSAHLARLETLARLSTAERTALLDDFLDDVRGDAAMAPEWADWWEGFRTASLPELPPEPTPDQLDAWLELAALLADNDFRDRIRALVTAAHEAPRPQPPLDLSALFADALEAEAAGLAPEDPAADELVARFVTAHESAVGGGGRYRRTLAHIERYDDPRARRYWDLVGRLQGRPQRPWPQAQAFDWLTAGLRARARGRQSSTQG